MPMVSLKHLLSMNFGYHRGQARHQVYLNHLSRLAALLNAQTRTVGASRGVETVVVACRAVAAALVLRDNETRIPNNRRASLRAVQHRSTRQSAFTKETNAIGKMVLQPRSCRLLKKMATAN